LQKYESKTSFIIQDESESVIFNITLDSVLSSHQDSVSSIKWGYVYKNDGSFDRFCLLSASFDFTVCVWKPDVDGLWSIDSTLGAMAGNKHAFYGA